MASAPKKAEVEAPKKEETKVQEPSVNSFMTPDASRSIVDLENVEISIQARESIVRPSSLGEKRLEGEFLLSNLTGCTIELLGVMQTLRLSNLRGCTVRCGPTARSVMMDKCIDCTIHVASHQIRIHESQGTTFYLLCRSRPIIEDCSGVSFGPYQLLSYSGAEEDLQQAGLSQEENLWDQVQDFNWLRTDPSPHYSLLSS